MFFSLDGVDGGGKSTQSTLFCTWLRNSGHDVVVCRDPGTTELGEVIRDILLTSHEVGMVRRAEMLLYMAARAQLVEEIIEPALEAGKIVVSDRYLLANVAYQGYGGQLEVGAVWDVGQVATASRMPDLTFVLDIDVQAATGRIDRQKDRMESQGDAFAQRVRQGYLTEANRNPDKIVVIDAGREIDAVQADIQKEAAKKIMETSNLNP